MANKTRGKKAAKTSGDDFETVAKRLECDENPKHFEAKLGKIAKAKPKARG